MTDAKLIARRLSYNIGSAVVLLSGEVGKPATEADMEAALEHILDELAVTRDEPRAICQTGDEEVPAMAFSKAGRPLGETTLAILSHARNSESITVASTAAALGVQVTNPLRMRLAKLEQAGALDRVSVGVYVLSRKGRFRLGQNTGALWPTT